MLPVAGIGEVSPGCARYAQTPLSSGTTAPSSPGGHQDAPVRGWRGTSRTSGRGRGGGSPGPASASDRAPGAAGRRRPPAGAGGPAPGPAGGGPRGGPGAGPQRGGGGPAP